MRINDAGLALLKHFEGLRLTAYPDPGTGGKPFTIGFGHTGDDVHYGLTITEEEAEALLKSDLYRFERGVDNMLSVMVTDNQFSALVCFAYNVGLHNLQGSHLLSKLNNGDISGTADEFMRWDRASGRVMPGLETRRQAERDLFLS